VRDRRRGGWDRPPDEDDNASWRLWWFIIGATTFTVIMYFLNLI
jgi:hypothetical protein